MIALNESLGGLPATMKDHEDYSQQREYPPTWSSPRQMEFPLCPSIHPLFDFNPREHKWLSVVMKPDEIYNIRMLFVISRFPASVQRKFCHLCMIRVGVNIKML